MIADRSNGEVVIRCTIREVCLIAQALAEYGDAIDARCTSIAEVLCPGLRRHGIVTVDELDACVQSAPDPTWKAEAERILAERATHA